MYHGPIDCLGEVIKTIVDIGRGTCMTLYLVILSEESQYHRHGLCFMCMYVFLAANIDCMLYLFSIT